MSDHEATEPGRPSLDSVVPFDRPRTRRWRLSALDAAFLHGESDRVPRHTLKLLWLDAVPDDAAIEAAVRWVARETPVLMAALRQTAWRPRPLLCTVDRLDLGQHVRREVAGGCLEDAVRRHASRLASARLRRDVPLWRVTIVQDAAAQRCCVIVQIHHAITDGGSFGRLLERIAASSRGANPRGSKRQAQLEDPATAGLRMPDAGTSRSLSRVHPGEAPRALWRALLGALRGSLARRRRCAASTPFAGPVTRINGPISAHRDVAWLTVPLDGMKAIKDAAEVSLNDVLLAMVSGALRSLDIGGGTRPMVAAMPIGAVDDAQRPRWWGNHVSNGFVGLADHIASPTARLQQIHRATEAAKAVHRRQGPRTIARWARLLTPSLVRTYRWFLGVLGRGAPINVIVSNVRGPADAIAVGPHTVGRLVSFGPLVDRVGLNVTAWSYDGAIALGIHTDASQVDDAQRVADAIERAYVELLTAHDEPEASSWAVQSASAASDAA